MADAGQYFVHAGPYTGQPSSGTPPRVIPGRPAPQPSSSQGIYGWRFDTATMALAPPDLVAKTVNPVFNFNSAVMRAHFGRRAPAPSEFTKVTASLASEA